MKPAIKLFLTLLLFFTVIDAQFLKAAETAKAGEKTTADTSSKNDKISLAEVEPVLYYMLRRYPKFYGDENTIQAYVKSLGKEKEYEQLDQQQLRLF